VASGREQYLQALASLSDLTRTQAERVAGLLAKQGEVQSAQVGRVAEDLLRRTQKNREIMSRLVQREVKRQLGVLGMATRDEVARLQQRVRALEQELERSSRPAPAGAASASEPGPAAAARPSRAASTPTSSTTSSAAKPATRAKAATAKPATRAKAATSKSGSAKPSTRTRTGGSSSRSTASSPGTRRTRSSGKSTPPDPGTPK
jgi:polyhydroxyalkanoate synthesis regulator phasin